MRRLLLPLLIVIGALVFLAANTFFIVGQAQQAIVLQFGESQRVINQIDGRNGPGLYVKAPFIQNVIYFDRRNLGFTLAENEIVAADQERLVVDAFVRWRVTDPLRFYQAAGSELGGRQRIERLVEAALRRALGGENRNVIVSERRAQLMTAISADVNRQAGPELGVQLIDVRIRQADLPRETQERVFQRMRTEREQVAAEIRAKGREQSARIRAEAERQAVVIRAEAREQAEVIRGAGDAERTRIFAQSFGRDPEFAAFYRSLQAYERALPEGTRMILPPSSEFFRYFRDDEGRR